MNIESLIHCGNAIARRPFEVVEIKGRGHPDTICDLICEHISNQLLDFYFAKCGRPLHYNIDKAYLVGGKAEPKFGGGKIIEPPKLYLGDRAADTFNGQKLEMNQIIESAVDSWLEQNLRFLRRNTNLDFKSEIKSGSESLSSVESRSVSNDTSVGVGSWPPTPLEIAVRELELFLNSEAFKKAHPETGEDIKIMAIRNRAQVQIICAIAFVDRFVTSMEEYLNKKQAVRAEIGEFLRKSNHDLKFSVEVNCLDNPPLGEGGIHLTVTGLSCENGDSGQVGRGNRVNELISFLRPQTMEAWAGKNPVTHVGKIYSHAAKLLAKKLGECLPEANEINIFLVGKIGSPVTSPEQIYCDLATTEVCAGDPSLKDKVHKLIAAEIDRAEIFAIPRNGSKNEVNC